MFHYGSFIISSLFWDVATSLAQLGMRNLAVPLILCLVNQGSVLAHLRAITDLS